MTKKKMPIKSCYFDCNHFKEAEKIEDPDICTMLNRIRYADEELRENTDIPMWCPDPNQIKIIEKCSECNNMCGFQGYCHAIHRVVANESEIDNGCPFPDSGEIK